MPALAKCPTCGFHGPHGFNSSYGGITLFCHGIPGKPERRENTHVWYKAAVNPNVQPTIGKLVKAERTPATYLVTPNLSEAFELGVVPTMRNDPKWIAAVRAEIAGKQRLAKRLFAEWSSERLRR